MPNPWDDAPVVQQNSQAPWESAPIVADQGKSTPWTDVAIGAIKNAIPSTYNVLSGVGNAFIHPVDTAGNVLDLAAGELSKAVPKSVSDLVDRIDPNPQAGQRAKDTATAFNNTYTNPVNGYGSLEGFKTKLANDPASVASDISTIASLGGLGLSKLGSATNISKAVALGDALKAGSAVTNPLSIIPAAVKAAPVAGRLVGNAAATALGSPLATGVGADTIKTAANAGLAGDSSFIRNLNGSVPGSDVVNAAKAGLSSMRDKMSEAYNTNMASVLSDNKQLGFGNINNAVQDAIGKTTYDGAIVKKGANDKVLQVKKIVDDWQSGDPQMRSTPQGLDKLKQSVGDVLESIPLEQKTARAAVKQIYGTIKDEISNQVPSYGKTMNDYSNSMEQINDIKKTLSLGDNASTDTGLRKLQSLTRNNANSGYGSRVDLAKALIDQGGNNIMPALAGQAMNSWFGRGIPSNMMEGGLGVAAALTHPGALAALPLTSPKLVGYAAYGAGRAASPLKNISNMVPQSAANYIATNGDKAKMLALLLNQTQQGQNEK